MAIKEPTDQPRPTTIHPSVIHLYTHPYLVAVGPDLRGRQHRVHLVGLGVAVLLVCRILRCSGGVRHETKEREGGTAAHAQAKRHSTPHRETPPITNTSTSTSDHHHKHQRPPVKQAHRPLYKIHTFPAPAVPAVVAHEGPPARAARVEALVAVQLRRHAVHLVRKELHVPGCVSWWDGRVRMGFGERVRLIYVARPFIQEGWVGVQGGKEHKHEKTRDRRKGRANEHTNNEGDAGGASRTWRGRRRRRGRAWKSPRAAARPPVFKGGSLSCVLCVRGLDK